MKLTLGFSPCPNDTFIFDALVNGRIDTEGLQFEPLLEDVETLNQWAREGRLHLSKLSLPAFFQQAHQYTLLSSGAALGQGVGPLLIAAKPLDLDRIRQYRIAIPGAHTTANFLLRYAFPQAGHRVPTLFSAIEDAVLNGSVDLGVIIHENRFTYQQKGLVKLCDLGEVWEKRENAPIPLGCIAGRKDVPEAVLRKAEALIRSSLTHAFSSYPALSDYTKAHAQAMEESVMRQHIELYVNNYSMDLGEVGKAAIRKLYTVYQGLPGSAPAPADLFL